MKKAELHCAYAWDCDECGRENFVRAVIVEIDEEDTKAMLEAHGGDPEDWRTGRWMTRPDEVTCNACGATFETEDDSPPPEDA